MRSQLRNLLFQLLSGLAILEHLLDSAGEGGFQLSAEHQSHVRRLVLFLEKIRRDANRYVKGDDIPDSQLGTVFLNFLAVLSLTQNERLTKGPEYAIQNVPLTAGDWSRVIRQFDSEQEEEVNERLGAWISLLRQILQQREIDTSTTQDLRQLIARLSKTADLVERAIEH